MKLWKVIDMLLQQTAKRGNITRKLMFNLDD